MSLCICALCKINAAVSQLVFFFLSSYCPNVPQQQSTAHNHNNHGVAEPSPRCLAGSLFPTLNEKVHVTKLVFPARPRLGIHVEVLAALRRLAIAHLSGSNVFHLLEARGWGLRYRSGSCVFVCKAAIAGCVWAGAFGDRALFRVKISRAPQPTLL